MTELDKTDRAILAAVQRDACRSRAPIPWVFPRRLARGA